MIVISPRVPLFALIPSQCLGMDSGIRTAAFCVFSEFRGMLKPAKCVNKMNDPDAGGLHFCHDSVISVVLYNCGLLKHWETISSFTLPVGSWGEALGTCTYLVTSETLGKKPV